MSQFQFSMHGVSVDILAEATEFEKVVDLLRLDFASFASSSSSRFAKIEVVLGRSTEQRFFPLVFANKKVRVYGFARKRLCRFANGVDAEMKNHHRFHREYRIDGPTTEAVWQVAYQAIHSAIGEMLDMKGYHRVHGLGWSYRDRRYLMPAPSGLGKSKLACMFAKHDPDVELFSDECPLVRDGAILPFPIRLALGHNVAADLGLANGYASHATTTKQFFPFPKKIGEAGRINVIFVGRRSRLSDPAIVPCGRVRAFFELTMGMIIGVGLPQMAEWMLRGDAAFHLVRILFSRMQTAYRIVAGTDEVFIFKLCENAERNALYFKDFQSRHSLISQ